MSEALEMMSEQPHEEVVEEEYIDTVMDSDMSVVGNAFVEEEEVGTDDNDYGGMLSHLYDSIVDFKKTGVYPAMADQRLDRSAHCHWRFRCNRFALSEDLETLLYYNEQSVNHDGNAKIVVKKGEVKYVVDRIHTLIGHLGMKRTQMAVMRKLYWRSVRNDVRNFVNNCDFCVRKKMEGKKLVKAPIDITSDDFELEITVRPNNMQGERLHISLVGIDEELVKNAAIARMTSYTFRNTSSEARERFRMGPTYFKRQPYVKRPRYSSPGTATGYLLPVSGGDEKGEPTFIEVLRGDALISRKYKYENEEDADDGQVTVVMEELNGESVPSSSGKTLNLSRRSNLRKDTSSRVFGSGFRRQKTSNVTVEMGVEGAASRLSAALAPRQHEKMGGGADRMLSSYEESQQRPEFCLLPPIMFMPSVDAEVVAMQKDLLRRQLSLQRLQEKVLQAQYDAFSRGVAVERFDEDVDDGRVVADEELNVIDGGEF